MKKVLFALIFILAAIPNTLFAQQQQIDELSQANVISLNNAGMEKFNNNDFTGAIEDFQSALSILDQFESSQQHPDYASILFNLGYIYGAIGSNDKALEHYQRALVIRKNVLGELHPDYATSLNNIGIIYGNIGNYTEAIKYLKAAQSINKDILGEEHPDYILSLNNIGNMYTNKGYYDEALIYLQNALSIGKKVFGEYHLSYATILNSIGSLQCSLGKYDKALKYYQQALDIRKIILGKQHYDYALSLNNIGFVYASISNYNKALEYYQHASDIYKLSLGEKHPNYALSLNNIGLTYWSLGNYEEALKYSHQALLINKEVYGEQHPSYATALNNIGSIYMSFGNYENALEYLQQALNIRKIVLGEQHPDYVTVLSNIGAVYGYLDDYKEALNYLEKALLCCKKIYGEQHPIYATLLNNIGGLYDTRGNYNEALYYLQNALSIRKNIYGETNDNYASSLNAIGRIFVKIGNYKEALRFLCQANFIKKEIFGELHPDYAMSLNDIGAVYSSLGNYEEALKYLKQALDIIKTVLGEQHPDYARSLNNIGDIYSSLGNYQEALRYFQQASDVWKIALGDQHSDYALSLNNLGATYNSLNNYNEALKYLKQALGIRKTVFGEQHPNYAQSLNNIGYYYYALGNYEEALKYYEQVLDIWKAVLGELHSSYAQSLNNIMFAYLGMQNYEQALLLYSQLCTTVKTNTLDNFKFLNEFQRTLYWKQQEEYFASVYTVLHFTENQNSKNTHLAYDAALFSKGLILASTVELRKVILESGDEELLAMYDQARSIEIKLQGTDILREERDSLRGISDQLNRTLMDRSKEYGDFTRNLAVDWIQVQEKLGDNEVAIEFVDYSLMTGDDSDTRYAALVLRKGMEHPVMVDITTENKIKHEMRNKEQIYINTAAKEFYKLIWAPLEQYINPCDNVYFSPSGLLHQLNIEFFANSESVPANELYNLYRLSSTRQLCIEHESVETSSAVLYGGLRYDTTAETMASNSRNWDNSAIRTRSITPLSDTTERSGWDYLKGTKTEVDQIESKLKSNKITPTKYVEFAGNEESFKALSEKRTPIIHIATHGFFLENKESAKVDYFKLQMIGDQKYIPQDNSMKRSGLILASGQKAWLGEPIPEGVEDGILLAEEISTLDLRGTNLVVLSCCETGLGEITSEGVFGLQRAFKMAGVETIIMSLWRVSDNATSLMMQTFYDSLLSGKSRRDAFLEAQRRVKAQFNDPYYWAAFIMLD